MPNKEQIKENQCIRSKKGNFRVNAVQTMSVCGKLLATLFVSLIVSKHYPLSDLRVEHTKKYEKETCKLKYICNSLFQAPRWWWKVVQ